MVNEWNIRRKYKCRRNYLIMSGVTMSITICVYMMGTLILSPVQSTQHHTYPYNNDGNSDKLDMEQDRGGQELTADFKSSSKETKKGDITNSWYWEDDAIIQGSNGKTNRHIEFDIKNKTKRLPQAIIIGVKKAGTRALVEYLRLHPRVKAPGPETHFFDKNYEKGLKWYRSSMPETFKGQMTIEKTPSYFVTKGIPERVYKMSKKTKLIVVFRDPVTRAVSDYAQLASRNPNSVKSFEEMVFVNNETTQIDTSWTIVKIGVYAQHLTRWLDYFPIQQIYFVSGERLIDNPAVEMKRIQQFLGLEQHITADNFTFNHTKGFPCYRRDKLKTSWHCLNNEKGRRHPDVSPAVRKRLQEFYRPFNDKLYSMTGQDFGWS